jgi:hypothetical protein
MVDTVLLPFRGRIVYDGHLAGPGMRLHFGGGIRRMLEDAYRQAKARSGIITSLPHAEERTTAGLERRLRELRRTEEARMRHGHEIVRLREQSRALDRLYHQEMGRAHARRYARLLREAGIEEGWFALYEGLVVASGRTREALEARVAEMLPPAATDLPYLFHLKKKSSSS